MSNFLWTGGLFVWLALHAEAPPKIPFKLRRLLGTRGQSQLVCFAIKSGQVDDGLLIDLHRCLPRARAKRVMPATSRRFARAPDPLRKN